MRTPSGGTWIREGGEGEPVNFLDPHVVKRVVGRFGSNWTRRREVRYALRLHTSYLLLQLCACIHVCILVSILQYTILSLTLIAVAKFLYLSLSFLLVATNPKDIRRKKALANPFTTTHEGKLLITEEGDKGQTLEQG